LEQFISLVFIDLSYVVYGCVLLFSLTCFAVAFKDCSKRLGGIFGFPTTVSTKQARIGTSTNKDIE
jgi:hypothetical protein